MGQFLKLVVLIAAFVWMAPHASALTDDTETLTNNFLDKYDAAKVEGRHTDALSLLTKYTEQTKGPYDPLTIKLYTKLGKQMSDDGHFKEAIEALNVSVERIIKSTNKKDIRLFEPYFYLASAHASFNGDMGKAKGLYDRALKILRTNNKKETELYAKSLLFVGVAMMQYGDMEGRYSVEATLDSGLYDEGDIHNFRREYGYQSYWFKAEEYISDALKTVDRINVTDPYLKDKINIALTKVQLLETAEYENVVAGTRGRLSKNSASKKYSKQQKSLKKTLDRLSEAPDVNRQFINIANEVSMQVAIRQENMDDLQQFCSSGTVDHTAQYKNARLYSINTDGSVFAPELGVQRVIKSIFKDDVPLRVRAEQRSESGKIPYFKPVCVSGQLKAVLVNVPTVTIEKAAAN